MKRQPDNAYYLLITYSDVFGQAPPALTDLRARLSALPKVSVVRACTIINALLRTGINSREPIDLPAHRGLVAAYFPGEIASRILRLEHEYPPRVAFHRQQLLFVMKEALQYASNDPNVEMANSILGEALEWTPFLRQPVNP